MVNIYSSSTQDQDNDLRILQYNLYLKIMYMCEDILTEVSKRFFEKVDSFLREEDPSELFLDFLRSLKYLEPHEFADTENISTILNRNELEKEKEILKIRILENAFRYTNSRTVEEFKTQMIKIHDQFPVIAYKLQELSDISNLNDAGTFLMNWIAQIDRM